MVYKLVSERAAPAETGSIAEPERKAKTSQDTLSATDIAPAWRAPRRAAHNKHGA